MKVRYSVACAALMSLTAATTLAADPVVNVYSYRAPQLIKPLFEAFTAKSGITVNLVNAQKGMLERLQREGVNSPADLMFTVDIGRLSDLKRAGLTQAVASEALERIPAHMRDPQGHWYGLTERARIIVASRDRVASGEIGRYEDLAGKKWAGRVCTRSGKHPYMVALIASLIAHHGEPAAEQWLTGVKANLARKPQGNDRAQVKAIKEGVCDVAVINHYYMYQMLQKDDQREWAEAVNIVFPNQDDRGTHMNVSGVALTKHAPNRENAVQLMEFLASPEAQRTYAEVNGEYPVTPGVELSSHLKAWGDFKQDTINLESVANQRSAAIKMADRVGYDG